ncbi:MAG: FecR domain-containing protein, partial [Pseudomonadota bacterium]
QAWQRIEAVNGRFAGQGAPATAMVAQAALAPRRSVRRRQAVQTLAVAFFAGGTAWTLQRHTPWREWTADLRTGPGERRSLTLEDGTQLVLNTRTAVDLRYGDTERRLRLLAGELLVDSGN